MPSLLKQPLNGKHQAQVQKMGAGEWEFVVAGRKLT